MTIVLETIALNFFKHSVLETGSIFIKCKEKNVKTQHKTFSPKCDDGTRSSFPDVSNKPETTGNVQNNTNVKSYSLTTVTYTKHLLNSMCWCNVCT